MTISKPLVLVCRFLVGAAFALSGWAKCVDPSGFVFKITEYLNAWHIGAAIPEDIVLVFCVLLSVVELVTGILLITGCLRRAAVICGLLMMVVMLPLTFYVLIKNPVQDCGCFGDLFHLSNALTFAKNILFTAGLIFLMRYNTRVKSLYAPSRHWLVVALTALYGLSLAVIGIHFQPVVDFRPFPVGSSLINDERQTEQPLYIYQKGEETREFALDNLPDSSWTFVDLLSPTTDDRSFAIFDGDEDVTEEVLTPEDTTPIYLLVITQPDISYITRARDANRLAQHARYNGERFVGIVAASDSSLQRWCDLARPDFPVFSASDTSLKQFARGDAALVRVENNRIKWKRNFATIDLQNLRSSRFESKVYIFDDGTTAIRLSAIWLALLLLSAVRLKFHRTSHSEDVEPE